MTVELIHSIETRTVGRASRWQPVFRVEDLYQCNLCGTKIIVSDDAVRADLSRRPRHRIVCPCSLNRPKEETDWSKNVPPVPVGS